MAMVGDLEIPKISKEHLWETHGKHMGNHGFSSGMQRFLVSFPEKITISQWISLRIKIHRKNRGFAAQYGGDSCR
jgi:hypothetical protein